MEYQVIRSSRKTISLEITRDGKLLVRCPRSMTSGQIHQFVQSKTGWIEKHMAKYAASPEVRKFTMEQIHILADKAKQIIPERVAYYAPKVGVSYGTITIRNQRSRWGSCSSLGNLNFNCLLVLAPPPVLDYVVVHELCHRKQMNHSQAFWAEVEKVCPDYKVWRKWLKEEGRVLIRRL